MSIPVLVEVYDEMRRLAIAGSSVAAGDFRLKKLIPPLQKSGEKAPVFAKVAQSVQAVVDSNEKTASAALLELTTLVNAILYTQGETGIAGDFKPLETTNLGGQATQASARVLKPLFEALSSTGSGRMELVRDAFERGTFKDLRLVKPALRALDDPYSEIGEFIADKVLPLYGKAILPELRATLDIKGRGGHVHRLHLMHRLDPQGSREVIKSALDEGSKEIRVAAVECLGVSEDDLVYLMQQASSKAKDVRAAALRALATTGARKADVVATLKKGIAGRRSGIDHCAREDVRHARDPGLRARTGRATVRRVAQVKGQERAGRAVTRLQQLVSCLEDRQDAKAEAFLLKCFDNAKNARRDQVRAIRDGSERMGRPRPLARRAEDAEAPRRRPRDPDRRHVAPCVARRARHDAARRLLQGIQPAAEKPAGKTREEAERGTGTRQRAGRRASSEGRRASRTVPAMDGLRSLLCRGRHPDAAARP
jgi:hypothetical protein